MTAISFRGQLLWENIKRGDLAAVVNLLESGGINIEEKDENGQTFLMLACERGELAIVRELIENDVDVNAVDNESWSALLCAAREGHLEILIELLERGAVLEHRDLCNWTALMWACYKGKTTVVQELLDRGANPNVKADHNMTCLAWAAGRGYTEVVSLLLQKGAKVNSPDKYGTTPLVWASRKGFLQIARLLLQEGSSVDVAGMNSWTALLAATKGGYTEVVGEILQRNANPNALDKDGFTALTIAAKEGYTQIAQDLLAHGAYVSLRDRDGDSILIHAVKGGHIEAVQALLNKYADVDTQGSDGKTALYWGIEKGHNDIVKLLLNNDAETELATKDNDTPLLRAVKSRNEECVRLLLEKNAKVSTTDKRGDTALHISLRARSKRITELLLRNPKNSRLLYRHNKSGETPYSIDAYYQKGILTQIFGHRNLNANDGENLLGYEIFSSALADILSEPALSTPITVGLYAKWGSGKSFLLGKLQNEMKSFTQQYLQGQFQFTWLLFCVFAVPNALVGLALGLSTLWGVGLGVTLALFLLEYGFLAFIWVGSHRYDMEFACRISMGLCRKMDILKLLLKVLFYMPQKHPNVDVPRVKFLFSDYTRITSAGGEKSLAAMIGTLCDAIEQEHSFIVTRLYRIFKPEPNAFGISGRFKSVCCVPYFVLVIFVLLCLVTGVALLVVYRIENNSVNAVLITVACIVGLAVMGNVYTWGLAIGSLYSPQKSRILQAAEQIESLKVDGFMQKIKEEVDLMSEMVDHMDRFTGNETRLVVVVDGLDSCEQEKVLTFLDTLNTLFSDTDSPFITILAVDPHIIIRGLEQNLCAGFHDTTIHGYDYLRNIVHLPFYLQSQGVKIQKEDYDNVRGSISFTNDVGFSHQDSTVSSLSLAEHKHKKSGYVKKKTTQRQASSSCHTSSFDLSKALFKNDYFSDINPRSMRRLMNIVAVTGRLLRAYNIEFSWYRLAGWINVIEQWPYRVSWIIMFWEEHREIADTVLLWEIYRKIAKDIPASKDVEPLLEIDRNVRKLETFFNNSSPNTPSLNVGDLKKFLPCTINLDPYLRKLIRELQHNVDVNRSEFGMAFTRGGPGAGPNPTDPQNAIARLGPSILRQALAPRTPSERRQPAVRHGLAPLFPHGHSQQSAMVPQALVHQYLMRLTQPQTQYAQTTPPATPTRPLPNLLQGGQQEERLSRMTTEDVCQLMTRIEGLDEQMLPQYQASLRSNNINGVVLLTCDIVELKDEMRMKFGDWQLFRVLVLWLREQDALRTDSQDSIILTNRPSQSDVRETEPNGHCGPLSDVKKSRNGESLPDGRSASKQQTEGALKPPMRRNNSILEQVEYESEILREVFEDFELEDDDSSEGESDSLKEPQKTDLNISRSIPDKVPSVRFFVENEDGHVQMGSNPDLGSSSKSADKGAQSSLSAETLVANTDDDQSVSKHASDSQPLLKLAAESRKGRNLLKTNLKSKHCPGSLKGKTISEESQPLEVSSDDDDSDVQPLQSPPNAGVPVKSAKGDDASADVSVASGSCVPSGSGQSSDGDAAVHYYPVTTVSTSSDILVWEPRKGATKEDKSYV